jgi:hypothetical protein
MAIYAIQNADDARPLAAAGFVYSTRFSGFAESGHLNEDSLLRLLRDFQPGITEVMLHPGYRDTVVGQ